MPRDWNAFYADSAYTDSPPDPLLVAYSGELVPGRALDLACGAGRHAIYLANLGWQVTAVDAAASAVERLRRAAPAIDTLCTDLTRDSSILASAAYDLICDFYYLQQDLFPAIRAGLKPGGTFIGAIHLAQPDLPRSFTLKSGELREEFPGWKILFYSETHSAVSHRSSARIVARNA